MIRKLIPLLLLAACSSTPKVPENILAPEKMEAVSWDMIRADGLLSYTIPADTLTPKLDKRTQLYREVLRIHGVSPEAYKRSLQFYQNRPDLLKVVFTKMSDRGSNVPQFTRDTTKPKQVKKLVRKINAG